MTHKLTPKPDALPATFAARLDRLPATFIQFDSLPNSAYVRLPTVAALRSSSPATVWRHVKAGLLPAPVKLGPNITAWRVGDLRRVGELGSSSVEV